VGNPWKGFPPQPQRSGAAKGDAPLWVADFLALGRVVRAGQGRKALLRRERLAQREKSRHHGRNRFSDRLLAVTMHLKALPAGGPCAPRAGPEACAALSFRAGRLLSGTTHALARARSARATFRSTGLQIAPEVSTRSIPILCACGAPGKSLSPASFRLRAYYLSRDGWHSRLAEAAKHAASRGK